MLKVEHKSVRALAAAITTALALSAIAPVQAATHLVTSIADSGPGTLRQAIIDANADATTPNTVTFQSGIGSTITLSTGQITVTKSMSIQGPGAGSLEISGGGVQRVLYIDNSNTSPMNVTVSGLSLVDGYASSFGAAIRGVGANVTVTNSNVIATPLRAQKEIYISSGNVLAGTGLIVSNSQLTCSGSQATQSQLVASGYIASVTISGTTISGCQARAIDVHANSISISGSAITGSKGVSLDARSASGTITVQDTTIRGTLYNGLVLHDGTQTLDNLLLAGNCLLDGSGSLQTTGQYSTTTLTNSTIVGSASCPGIQFYAPHSTFKLVNDTIAGNSGGLSNGAGIDFETTYSSLTVESSTIFDNDVTSSVGKGGGIYNRNNTSQVTIHNSIIANNEAPTGPDLYTGAAGAIIDNGYNLIMAPGTVPTASSDIIGQPPLLQPLANWGGPTPTALPKSGSPVVNAGDATTTLPSTDQRGFNRIIGGRIDIGAVERQTTEPIESDTIFLDGFDGY